MKKILLFASFIFIFTILPCRQVLSVEKISNNGIKGCAGLGLLGAELVVNIEAAVGVKKAWILALTGLVGGAGGAVGGYFAETKASEKTGARVGVGLLAGGMALFVPTMIIVTALTKHYIAKESETKVEVTTETTSSAQQEGQKEEKPQISEPPAETGENLGAAMINVRGKRVSPGVPLVAILPGSTIELRFGLFNMTF